MTPNRNSTESLSAIAVTPHQATPKQVDNHDKPISALKTKTKRKSLSQDKTAAFDLYSYLKADKQSQSEMQQEGVERPDEVDMPAKKYKKGTPPSAPSEAFESAACKESINQLHQGDGYHSK